MRPERGFLAARALANHCEGLIRPGPQANDISETLAAASERLARSLRGGLAPLLGGDVPEVAVGEPQEMNASDFRIAGPGIYSLYALGQSGERMLSTIDAEAVLRLVDRAFGGPGEPPNPFPKELPLSAELMVQRIEAIVAMRLAQAVGGQTAIVPLRRDRALGQLRPYASTTRLMVVPIAITERNRTPWLIKVALPAAVMPDLLGMSTTKPSGAPVRRAPADPLSRPFADMPLPVTALIVDACLPLAAVSRLEPGQVLSLPIARNVPLIVAGRTLGHGSIGAVDDRVAVQLHQIS